MGFQYVPSQFRLPQVPWYDPPGGIWRGKGADLGLYAFRAGYGYGYVMVREGNLLYRLKLGDDVFSPVFTDINGYVYWEGRGYIYHTMEYGWVWCDSYPGFEPVETYKSKDGEYEYAGDNFYTFTSPPTPGQEVKAQPRGRNRKSGKEKTLTAVWPRWESPSYEFGVYEGKDGETGQKVLGLPRFTGDNGETFLRSLNKENGRYTYGRIRNVAGTWVIGEVGSVGGWHEGSEPSTGGSVTFRFVKPQGSEAVGTDITVSFDRYVPGDEREAAYLGSVAIWR